MQACLGTACLLTSEPGPGKAVIPSFSLWLVWDKEGQTYSISGNKTWPQHGPHFLLGAVTWLHFMCQHG